MISFMSVTGRMLKAVTLRSFWKERSWPTTRTYLPSWSSCLAALVCSVSSSELHCLTSTRPVPSSIWNCTLVLASAEGQQQRSVKSVSMPAGQCRLRGQYESGQRRGVAQGTYSSE